MLVVVLVKLGLQVRLAPLAQQVHRENLARTALSAPQDRKVSKALLAKMEQWALRVLRAQTALMGQKALQARQAPQVRLGRMGLWVPLGPLEKKAMREILVS